MVVRTPAARVVAQALGLSRPQDCGVATHCHHQAAAVIEARACEFLRSPPCRRVGPDAAALGAEDCGVGEPFTDIEVECQWGWRIGFAFGAEAGGGRDLAPLRKGPVPAAAWGS